MKVSQLFDMFLKRAKHGQYVEKNAIATML